MAIPKMRRTSELCVYLKTCCEKCGWVVDLVRGVTDHFDNDFAQSNFIHACVDFSHRIKIPSHVAVRLTPFFYILVFLSLPCPPHD